MKKLILGIATLSLMVGSAYAADCTPQNLDEKSIDLRTKFLQIIEKDPSKASEWQDRMIDWLAKGKDVKDEDACDYIDGFVKEIDKAL